MGIARLGIHQGHNGQGSVVVWKQTAGQKLVLSKAGSMTIRSWWNAWMQVEEELPEAPTHWRPTESVFIKLVTEDEPSDLWKGGKRSYLSNVTISRQLALALWRTIDSVLSCVKWPYVKFDSGTQPTLVVCPMLRCKYLRDDKLSFTLMFPRAIMLRGQWADPSVRTDVGVLLALWWEEKSLGHWSSSWLISGPPQMQE